MHAYVSKRREKKEKHIKAAPKTPITVNMNRSSDLDVSSY